MQDLQRFCWETSKAIEEEVVLLKHKFSKAILFSADDIKQVTICWNIKFLGHGSFLGFIEKEMKFG